MSILIDWLIDDHRRCVFFSTTVSKKKGGVDLLCRIITIITIKFTKDITRNQLIILVITNIHIDIYIMHTWYMTLYIPYSTS